MFNSLVKENNNNKNPVVDLYVHCWVSILFHSPVCLSVCQYDAASVKMDLYCLKSGIPPAFVRSFKIFHVF